MKKIITLMLAGGLFLAANAQTPKEEARKVILGQPKTTPSTSNPRDVILGGGNGSSYPNSPNSYPGGYPSGTREARINQINREYDAKIQSIRNNPHLSQAEKDRAIRQLESDRARKIREINSQYSTAQNKTHKKYTKRYHDDEDYSNDRKDNGKHLGWEKGKGNPHKNGGKSKH